MVLTKRIVSPPINDITMKNKIKTAMIAICLAIINYSCYAQRSVSLRTYEQMRNNYINGTDRSDDGEDISYIKDTNNELDKFVGTWKGAISNRNYEVSFVKRTNYKRYVGAEKSWDLLIGWITVKDDSGNVIFTNTNKTEARNGFFGENFQTNTNTYRMYFSGKCTNDAGNAFLSIDATTGKMRIGYGLLSDIFNNNCPDGFVPVLPTTVEGLTLTKQP